MKLKEMVKGIKDCYSDEAKENIKKGYSAYYNSPRFEENKKKMKGRIPWNKGKKLPEEVKVRLREKALLQKQDPEYVAKWKAGMERRARENENKD